MIKIKIKKVGIERKKKKNLSFVRMFKFDFF